MEQVENREMYLIVQANDINKKFHNYKLHDVCDYTKKHNEKYISLCKAKRKILKSTRDKKRIFMETLHEKVRKSINPELPSRLESIILYDNIEDCLQLAKKWEKNTGNPPLGLYKVRCSGLLHACATTPDELRPSEFTKDAIIPLLKRFWQGDEKAVVKEYFFKGTAEIVEVLDYKKKIFRCSRK